MLSKEEPWSSLSALHKTRPLGFAANPLRADYRNSFLAKAHSHHAQCVSNGDVMFADRWTIVCRECLRFCESGCRAVFIDCLCLLFRFVVFLMLCLFCFVY